jgi:hypothetical protein
MATTMEGNSMIVCKDETEMVSLVDSREDDEDPTTECVAQHCSMKPTLTDDEVDNNSPSCKRKNIISSTPPLPPCSASIFRAMMVLGIYFLLVAMIIVAIFLFFSFRSSSQHSLYSQPPPAFLNNDGDADDSSSLVVSQTHNNQHGLSMDATLRPVSSITAKTQIEHYRAGTGLILNIHLTHHAGTTMCRVLGHAVDTNSSLTAPGISCLEASSDQTTSIAPHDLADDWPLLRPWRGRQPWSYHETEHRIVQIRKYFHFVSWESYIEAPKKTPLSATNYEHPNLVSIYVPRDPLSRLLAGDAWTAQNFPDILQLQDDYNDDPTNSTSASTMDSWWQYARSTRNVDNFALRILAGHGCCNGSSTERSHLDHVKTQLLDRFTFVLDIACLDAGMDAVATLLGFTPNFRQRKSYSGDESNNPQQQQRKRNSNNDDDDDSQRKHRHRRHLAQNHYHAPPSERIPAGVYEYLVAKNKLSIELHEYAVNRSLVKCSEAWDA